MEEVLKKLKNKQNLNFEESKSVFESIMSGKVKEEQIYDFLTFSSAKGETSDEIAGGVYVLRNKAAQVNVPDDTIDTCEHSCRSRAVKFSVRLRVRCTLRPTSLLTQKLTETGWSLIKKTLMSASARVRNIQLRRPMSTRIGITTCVSPLST